MRTSTKIAAVIFAALLALGSYFYFTKEEPLRVSPTHEKLELASVAGGCYGASCNGKNPTGLCADGKTVASKEVPVGLLELRYSPGCKSNWGRYTPWLRAANYHNSQKELIHVRVTAWNPGKPSYGTAHHDDSLDGYGSSWSFMVDGTGEACTGVEVYIAGTGKSGFGSDGDSLGWSWGPCR